ncbi:MAG TPA: FCD domain-containing protein [Clostridia bacterium]|nr:FCD domain-containing protein [Clostridia bacterium]
MDKEIDQIMNEESQELFAEHKKETAVDFVINSIKNLLIMKKLIPGDRLPSESELCKSMAVSRSSLREAMKILSAFGIVEIKRGDGTYIAQADNKIKFDPFLFSLIQSQPDIKDLAQLRGTLEHAVVKLIIENAEDEDIENIRKAHLEMEKVIQQGVFTTQAISYCEANFHNALGHATRNKLVEKIYNFVMELFNPFIKRTHENEKTGESVLRIHKNILDSLAEKDMRKAYEAIEESIIEWQKLI